MPCANIRGFVSATRLCAGRCSPKLGMSGWPSWVESILRMWWRESCCAVVISGRECWVCESCGTSLASSVSLNLNLQTHLEAVLPKKALSDHLWKQLRLPVQVSSRGLEKTYRGKNRKSCPASKSRKLIGWLVGWLVPCTCARLSPD